MKYKITAEVYGKDEDEALQELGYRITTHQDISIIADRLESLEIQEVEEEE